ncbi:DUF3800 domain-containing protein [Bifidobacterium sp. ESL0769]|uniref:DUF3800 domain-containing protein n=1 Tax=Bifidobacterium sp. ESL0769 TaxID=2983229 RepID=UPI0023F7AD1D|nr:DUF3800 domain-containing protein [Bifidobacterium sp. ESL0769]WEV67399.1 DUF3800 domain-containing protein [Bifidobacterium sp. ESL0769]
MQRELSIFIDESGNEDLPQGVRLFTNAHYIVALVFHDQAININPYITKLEESIDTLSGIAPVEASWAIHSAPLIRGDEIFNQIAMKRRRQLFDAMLNFMHCCGLAGVKARSINVDKRLYCSTPKGGSNYLNKNAIRDAVANHLTNFIRENREYFSNFQQIKIYYDFGQRNLGSIIHDVFEQELSASIVLFKAHVKPENYKLFQAADMVCTLSLLNLKLSENLLTNSDKTFFKGKKAKTEDKLAVEFNKVHSMFVLPTPSPTGYYQEPL